jgi:hypothetical protein
MSYPTNVITGFPFQLLYPATPDIIYLPFFDVPTEQILYWQFDMTFLVDGFGIFNERIQWETLFQWLNYLNPDWTTLTDPATIGSFSFGPPSGIISGPPMNYCQFQLDPAPPWQTFWWGDSPFSKYGLFSWIFDGIYGPPHWVNWPVMQLPGSSWLTNGFAFAMQPGVSGSGNFGGPKALPPVLINHNGVIGPAGAPGQHPYGQLGGNT